LFRADGAGIIFGAGLRGKRCGIVSLDAEACGMALSLK